MIVKRIEYRSNDVAITCLVAIFRMIKMKNASMSNVSFLSPISYEILPRFCSDDLIQILIKIGLVPNVKNQDILEGFVWVIGA